MIPEAALFSFIAALFSMMNPIGNVGVFAGMTSDRPKAEVSRIGWTCAGAVIITLLIVAWTGSLLLQLFGITVNSLRAAGGVIVLLIAIHMLFNKAEHQHSPEELEDAKSRGSIGVVPLAIPIVAGPGTMATVLVAAQQHPSILSKLEISIVIVAMALICGLLFSFATPISKKARQVGNGRRHPRHGHDTRRNSNGNAGRRTEGIVTGSSLNSPPQLQSNETRTLMSEIAMRSSAPR